MGFVYIVACTAFRIPYKIRITEKKIKTIINLLNQCDQDDCPRHCLKKYQNSYGTFYFSVIRDYSTS